jgi:ABC-type multidrug transport system ATPase subunit
LRRVGLHQDGNKLVGEFSKGMRSRLTLARALLHRPELLFLDEPTAGLDPVNARLVRQVIREVREAGATIFLTTHDMVTADELCDRVAFLVEGAIAALDSPRALRLAHGSRRVRLEILSAHTASVRGRHHPDVLANARFLVSRFGRGLSCVPRHRCDERRACPCSGGVRVRAPFGAARMTLSA